ncbi:hypothetical protein JHK82_014395 [Glycine max]|uniref:Uncharacterized protein n=2 Tax=Glycine subgen. Soja TaxID=1462606 RepID=A0A0R0JIJ4_SOYBN|nr:hypothetical protein JHK86_014423 [Glycine max]KAG5147514.1 hypothetical protein JHK82_014395 [Glycine max]KAH1124215.1 hypothetical protein GYH30_014108 [Glycine max]KRH52139.1 hypothetical protein GLYMA_06G049100v4 [Glycine max]RZC05852.1 hypothetical protein D0Y65_013764 [Glycine soja]
MVLCDSSENSLRFQFETYLPTIDVPTIFSSWLDWNFSCFFLDTNRKLRSFNEYERVSQGSMGVGETQKKDLQKGQKEKEMKCIIRFEISSCHNFTNRAVSQELCNLVI